MTLEEGLTATAQAYQAIPYAEGSPEMQASTFFELTYRTWVLTHLPIKRTEAINGGAEATGCSVETAARYLAKLTSMAGPLTTTQNDRGIVTIERRSGP